MLQLGVGAGVSLSLVCQPEEVYRLREGGRSTATQAGTDEETCRVPIVHISTSTEGDVLVLTVELGQVKDYVLAEELRYELAARGQASQIPRSS